MRAPPATFSEVQVRARRVVARTQTLFFVLLACCVLIDHSRVVQNEGISFYGAHAPTVALAFIAYGVASVGLWRCAQLFYDATLD